MSRTNLQIVEETIDIEQQVKAAELRASQPKNKSNNNNAKRSSTGDQSIEGKQKSVTQQQNNNQVSKTKENPFVIPNVEPPETISTYIVTDRSKTNKLRHGIPITPTSPDFSDITKKLTTPTPPIESLTRRRSTLNQSSRESQRDEYFKKHFPETDKLPGDDKKESCTEQQQSDEKIVVSMSISSPDENMSDYEDDEEEVDQLQPSDRSDSEMEGVEVYSKSLLKSNISKSSTEVSNQENAVDLMSIDTTSIWVVPIEGTTVSPGLTPHRKRKIIIIEDSDEEKRNSKIFDIDNLKKCKNKA
jgi:hypothetical protein